MPKKSSKQQTASASKYTETTLLRLEVGTLARIDAVLVRGSLAYAARSDRTRD